MREIKFRAWDRENKRMYQVVELSYEDDVMLAWRDRYENEPVSWIKSGLKIEEECNLMQFTGLKDKNGKEIYEGDIVEHCECVDEYTTEGPYEGTEVVFEDGMFCFKNDCPNPLSIYVDFEVIGNIYEHSHLLEGDTNE